MTCKQSVRSSQQLRLQDLVLPSPRPTQQSLQSPISWGSWGCWEGQLEPLGPLGCDMRHGKTLESMELELMGQPSF